MSKTFHIANFGCRTSQSEGASIQQELVKSDAVLSNSPYSADVVIVNSCTVTAEADREVRQVVRRVASRNPEARIIVTGCYAQRAPAELAALPQVRYVVGNSHKAMVGELALSVMHEDFQAYGRAEVICSSIFLERELKPVVHVGSGGRTRAVVKVQDGCNANCSFCIIPSVRGRSRSMPKESILLEISELVSRGYKEVILSGIHLGTWGRDLDGSDRLSDLIRLVLQLKDLERLRLSSIEPLEVTEDIISLVANHPLMAHHMHVPLQSGSPRVLRAMRRPYLPDYYASLIEQVHCRVPDAALGADVMVGFPGETDDEFMETYHLIEDSPLTYLHVFPYSARPGTASAKLPGQIPEHVARFRGKALRDLIGRKNEAFRRGMIGSTVDVLTLEDGSGISDNFVRVTLARRCVVNEWMQVRVTGLDGNGVSAIPIQGEAGTVPGGPPGDPGLSFAELC
jgi:threonylcarbamoyladenosine tRNA methylthiotransferase MtaB